MQDARCRMQDAGCRMQDARCRMQDARCEMQDARSCIPYPASRIPIFGILRKISIFALNQPFVKILFRILLSLCFIGQFHVGQAQKTVRDFDGNTYKTLVIANKTWMSQNLNVSHYRNGDAIPEAKSGAEWDRYSESRMGCWCYYDFKTSNGRIYGKLYNWFAVNDPRGLAPKGWHVPKDVEWLVFTNFPGNGERPGLLMKSPSGWSDGYQNCGGINTTGFNGLPGGSREVGFFSGIGLLGHWWCSTESEVNFARTRGLACMSKDLWLNVCLKQCGNSVRCVKD